MIALDDDPPDNFCKPAVDPLLTSATEIWQGGVLAVVLTGMGSDGVRGGKDIVAAGGSVIAQDEATSVVWGMPGAVANAGICAAILPLNQIAPKLVRLLCGRPFVTPLDYEFLRKLLKERSGLDLSRRQAISGRKPVDPAGAQGRPAGHRRTGAEAEGRRRSADRRSGRGDDHQRDVLFPRQGSVRSSSRRRSCPNCCRRAPRRRSLRIWCAASSTGQEPYSIAMCLKEIGAALAGWRVEIIATDLSQGVLEKSRAGIFSQFEVQRGLPIQMLVKHFTQVGELWQLNADIRAMVQHRQLNLLQDFSHLGIFDVIFCRNVLIYFDQDTKTGIFDRLARMIEPDGCPDAGRRRNRGRDNRCLQALSGPARALPPECRPHRSQRRGGSMPPASKVAVRRAR